MKRLLTILALLLLCSTLAIAQSGERKGYPGCVSDGAGGINCAKGALTSNSVSARDVSIRGMNVPGTYSGLYSYGTSITYGTAATAFGDGRPNGYAARLAPYIGGVPCNMGMSGAQAPELIYQEILVNSGSLCGRAQPTLQNNVLRTIEIGANDVTTYGTNADKQEIYKGSLRAALARTLIPSISGNTASPATVDYQYDGWSSGCARTGTWSVTSIGGVKSSTQNDVLTCSITTYGGPIFVAYYIKDGSTATATLSIDGGSAIPLTTVGYNGATIATGLGRNYAIVASSYPVAAGAHTLVYTVTSNTADSFEVDFVATPPAVGSLKYPGAPAVFLQGVLRQQNDANAATTLAYDGFNKSLCAEFYGYGLNCSFVDIRGYLNTTTDMNDALHPSDAGHAKMMLAYRAAIQPVTNATDAQSIYTWNGAHLDIKKFEALITLSTTGTTTDSTDNLLPAGAMLGPLTCTVNTTITTAANWQLGDASTAGRFCGAQTSLTGGNQVVCGAHIGSSAMWQAAAAKLRVTTNVNPGAGKLYCTGWYMQAVAGRIY